MGRKHRKTSRPRGRLSREPILRFAEHVLGWPKTADGPFPTGCWVWIGARRSDGRGSFRLGGRGIPKQDAAEFAYEVGFDAVPDGKEVILTCQTKGCVHPDHQKIVEKLRYERQAVMNSKTRVTATTFKSTKKPGVYVGHPTMAQWTDIKTLIASPEMRQSGPVLFLLANDDGSFTLKLDINQQADTQQVTRQPATTTAPARKPVSATAPRRRYLPLLTSEEEEWLDAHDYSWEEDNEKSIRLRAKSQGRDLTTLEEATIQRMATVTASSGASTEALRQEAPCLTA